MLKRLIRAIRSFFGFGVGLLEDPKLILQQNVRDLHDQIPKMNEQIAMVRANVTLLERENAGYVAETADLTNKIKAAIQGNREDIAGTYATQLQHKKEALTRNAGQLMVAKAAYAKAEEVKKAFMRNVEAKTQQVNDTLRESERAEWQRQVADTMEKFTVAGVDDTHDEMLRKVQETTALNSARMDMAMDNVDVSGAKVEEDAEKLRSAELVKQFKMEMGMNPPAPEAIPVPASVTRNGVQL